MENQWVVLNRRHNIIFKNVRITPDDELRINYRGARVESKVDNSTLRGN